MLGHWPSLQDFLLLQRSLHPILKPQTISKAIVNGSTLANMTPERTASQLIIQNAAQQILQVDIITNNNKVKDYSCIFIHNEWAIRFKALLYLHASIPNISYPNGYSHLIINSLNLVCKSVHVVLHFDCSSEESQTCLLYKS